MAEVAEWQLAQDSLLYCWGRGVNDNSRSPALTPWLMKAQCRHLMELLGRVQAPPSTRQWEGRFSRDQVPSTRQPSWTSLLLSGLLAELPGSAGPELP